MKARVGAYCTACSASVAIGPDYAEAVQGTVELVLRLPLTQADELLWEAAEQIGQMRAATFFGTLLATGLVLFVCCARSR